MASWFDAVLNPLDSATKLADHIKSFVDVRDQIKFGEAVSELYGQLLAAYRGAIDAQRQEAAMLEENRALREKVNQLDDWNTQKQRYTMEKYPPGIIVYSLKPEVADGQPAHYACPTCYHRSLIRPLQVLGTVRGVEHFRCHECGSGFEIGIREAAKIVRRGPRGDSWLGN